MSAPARLVPCAGTLPLTPEREAEQRRRVCAEARSWVGTPYRQQGMVRGRDGAVDCSMLLVACWVGAGVVEPFDPRPYPPEWHLHREEERYLAWMEQVARPVERPRAGDVMLLRYGRCYSHSVVVLEDLRTGVHAFLRDQFCTLVRLDEGELSRRPHIFFDVWAPLRELGA